MDPPPPRPEDLRERRGEGLSDRSSGDEGARPSLNTATTAGVRGHPGHPETTSTITTTAAHPPVPLRPGSSLQLSRSGSVSLVPPGDTGDRPRRQLRHTQSLRVPGVSVGGSFTHSSFTSSSSSSSSSSASSSSSCSYRARSASLRHGSSRDALGYAALRRLQQQRMQLHALAAPGKRVLFADAVAMTIGRPDARFAT